MLTQRGNRPTAKTEGADTDVVFKGASGTSFLYDYLGRISLPI
jgi:hypothetical protein